MSTATYIAAIVAAKTALAANLTTMGVAASDTEPLDDLVAKVLDITTGVDVSDTTAVAADVATGKYFYTSVGVRTEGAAVAATNYAPTVSVGTAVADV